MQQRPAKVWTAEERRAWWEQETADRLFRANQNRAPRIPTSEKLGLHNQGKYTGAMHQRKVAKLTATTSKELAT